MREVRYMGVSGPVAFDETGSRIGITFIQQNFYGEKRNVASFDEIVGSLTWLEHSSTLWSGKEVPKDRFIYQDVLVAPSSTAFGVVVTLVCVGCLLSFTFLFFNIYYRNNRSIKMSSPMVNNVIIAGCLLMYIVILVNAADYYRNLDDPTGDSLCSVRTWLLSLGFTSLFGALFSKTYRVYVVFRDYNLRRKAIKDYHVFGMIGIMLVVDVVILVPWTIFFPLEKATLSRSTMDVSSNNMIYSKSYLHCYNESSAYWIAAIYVYKGLLLAFGTFLAWETRQVTIPVLNDSKYIGACIYNVVIVCIFGVPLAHVLPTEQKTLTFVLESSLLFFCTTSSQCIIFIPKIKMRNQVHGQFLTSQIPTEPIGSVARPNGIHTDLSDFKCEDTRPNEDLKEENAKLRMDLANETIAIARLRKSLLHITGNVHFYKNGTEYVVVRSSGLKSASSVYLGDRSDHTV
ncbi:gamma-aminobutyric acid type B receptor subunit 2-like [Mercenaria mercenaria]|uniref:gamma-aminobutyric acid type B receptor subunit 2-like n=1 Tax=Mercenaria mercenaria TaxID=6596 RepID=UPI00234E8B8E|nr:gamma-aminobutyric acid type B receptor subunit 2-like [Mercenaria mercenaria]